jgi:hypothetical protein
MSFIVTSQGDEVDLRYPPRSLITPLDTAWGLSQLNRFAGRTRRPYSVAEHSLLVCEILARVLHVGVMGQMGGLLHDAHEPWQGADLPSPHKHEFDAEHDRAWSRWEQRWMRQVREAFHIGTACLEHGEAIRLADRIALATEQRDLMPASPTPWVDLQGIEPVGWINLASDERTVCTWEHWRDCWLDKYHDLDAQRAVLAFEVMQP